MFDLRFYEIYRSEEFLLLLWEGILLTSTISISGGVLGFALALLLAIIRYWNIPFFGFFASCYVEFIRNTPLIVQLFFFAFGLPALLSYVWPFWCHALLALIVNFSGYFSAILYSGFLNVPNGQIEAASALGLRKWNIFSKIILPQSLNTMYPSLCSQFIFVFLTTGVISEIGVTDFTHAGLFIDSRTFRSFEVFILLTIGYILMALIFRFILNTLFSITKRCPL